MKQFLSLLFVILVLTACNQAEKNLTRGNYDLALRQAIKKLRKRPDNPKYLSIVEGAFEKSNAKDVSQINYLKKEGSPESWDKIYVLYGQLKQRQQKLNVLMHMPANVVFHDYDADMIDAKKKAAEYHYAKGSSLLQTGRKHDAREAYNHFGKVKNYFTDYGDVDSRMAEAQQNGINHILLKMENRANVIVPAAFEQELLKLTVTDLNQQWLQYHSGTQDGIQYDYYAVVNLQNIEVTPEAVKERHFTETKKIKDGWQYMLDDNGNVMKDTSGNDIKVDKYVNASCEVVESHQHKAANVSGMLDIVQVSTGELMGSQPLSSTAVFDHYSARALGNQKALKPATRKMCNLRPIPFPTNEAMLIQASQVLKENTKNLLYNNPILLQ